MYLMRFYRNENLSFAHFALKEFDQSICADRLINICFF
jgi:hypothetical protein